MTKNRKNDAVGDTMSPPLSPDATALREGADQGKEIDATGAPVPPKSGKISSLGDSLRGKADSGHPPGTCIQTLWFTFFFDGTGNNLDADVGTLKHSNVARLFRCMPINDRTIGRYSFYIPGVGTYFKEINDPGGSTLGLGMGDRGKERLAWALEQFEENLKVHVARASNPSNAIVEINVAAFGFSRGAALARAFICRFVQNCCKLDAQNCWRLNPGGYKTRVRFMGLFDTVASVGMPMSSNNITKIATARNLQYKLWARLDSDSFAAIRPGNLAFAVNARPGADPAPGSANGHLAWGDEMAIPEMVEAVQHFVAAHEIRNSFPVDSVSVVKNGQISKPAQFIETVYPGGALRYRRQLSSRRGGEK